MKFRRQSDHFSQSSSQSEAQKAYLEAELLHRRQVKIVRAMLMVLFWLSGNLPPAFPGSTRLSSAVLQ